MTIKLHALHVDVRYNSLTEGCMTIDMYNTLRGEQFTHASRDIRIYARLRHRHVRAALLYWYTALCPLKCKTEASSVIRNSALRIESLEKFSAEMEAPKLVASEDIIL